MDKQRTIREQVTEVLTVINEKFNQLNASECAEYAQKLSALLPIVLENEAMSEGVCNLYMVEVMKDGSSAAKAKIEMSATEQWLDWKKITALRKGMEETIKTLKKNVDAKVYEYNTGKFTT